MTWIGPVLGVAAVLGMAVPAAAQRPVVAELFTSQGCSSCPPADALLSELARTRPDVLALAFHVTYWDSLGWRDPFSLDAATARQRGYARQTGEGTVYTPELVVEGARGVVGSDGDAVAGALSVARDHLRTVATPRLVRQGDTLLIAVGGAEAGGGAGAGRDAVAVLLVGYDPERRTAVGRGENGGRTLLEANIVRSIQKVADWYGARLSLALPVPPGEAFAVLLQAADGHIVGAARLTAASS